MATKIITKNSGTTTVVPSSLEYGELAINYYDGKLYYKNNQDDLIHDLISESIAASSIDELLDVDTTTSTPSANEVMKWNGSKWVPGDLNNASEFTFSITSFTDGQPSTQLMGDSSAIWKAASSITFASTYNSGPPSVQEITESGGSTPWTGVLAMTETSPNVGDAVSADPTYYPSAVGGSVTFTLNTTPTDSSVVSVNFQNYIRCGGTTVASGYSAANIQALAQTKTVASRYQTFTSVVTGASNYVVFAYPSRMGTIAQFRVDGVTAGFEAYEDVASVINDATPTGYSETYRAYRLTTINPGTVSVQAISSATPTSNTRYWGLTTTASGYSESDIESLGSSDISTTEVGSSFTLADATSPNRYVCYAYPASWGLASDFHDNYGGFAFDMANLDTGTYPGLEHSPETVSVTNAVGFTEDYFIYRSEQIGLTNIDFQVEA